MESLKELFEQLIIKRIVKYALYMFLALLCQNMIFSQVMIAGVHPFILPAVAVSVGMFEGAKPGTVFGLIMGIFADMAFVENTLMFTMLFSALGFFAGFAAQFYVNKRFFAFMGIAAAASLATALLQMLATFAGDAWSSKLLITALLQTLWSLPFSAVAYFPPARWID